MQSLPVRNEHCLSTIRAFPVRKLSHAGRVLPNGQFQGKKMTVKLRAFTSPTLVLLAFDWDQAEHTKDFLGFAIRRSPGFDGTAPSFLPNRITFTGPRLGPDKK